ncbi:hypothetical protein HWV62_1144 [Athelia sp. TMB]|nr:hypothetical protein HWV62_1144 [Athelia sp. TMB]
MSTGASKRKRSTRYNITSSSGGEASTPALPSQTSRSISFNVNPVTKRLNAREELVEVDVSAEDLEILQQHPEFCIPADSLLDFETLCQQPDEVDEDNGDPQLVSKVKKWTGTQWEGVSLCSLGLVFHLGHNGLACEAPADDHIRPLLVVHVNGVHEVRVRYCGCGEPGGGYYLGTQLLRASWMAPTHIRPRTAFTFEALKHFHHLTLQGKTTAWDFYNALIHETDNTGINAPPRHFNEFLRVMRWWRHLKMLKRAGRGHDPAGVAATKPGELAVECPACPQPEWNLPEWWQTAPVAIAWIFTLYLAMDANFRLKLRDRKIKNDPVLGPGWAYFVDNPPYKKLMASSGPQEEPNTCDSGLHAIDHANTRFARNNIANGVGNLVCARHTFVQKIGAVDLDKGENMDFAFLSVLMMSAWLMLVISYDIACQWSVNLASRIPRFPEAMQFDLSTCNVTPVIPKFHIYAHGKSCQSRWSLNFLRWMGRIDGEGVEREWFNINPVALSTRLMGPGARWDTLDDHWGAWNWRKVTGLGRRLYSKFQEAIVESRKHKAAFNALTSTFQPDAVARWTEMITKWQEDPEHKTENPYEEVEIETTKQDIHRALLNEEQAEARAEGISPLTHETTASTFLNTGLDLEHQQRVVRAKAAAIRGQGIYDKAALERSRAKLMQGIGTWQSIQPLYMPGVTQLRQTHGTRTDAMPSFEESEKPEAIPLYLPSAMPASLRKNGCVPGLIEKYVRLRTAEAYDSLTRLRRQLRIMTGVFNYKKTHVSGGGQRANTRARTLMARITQKTKLFADRYRCTRAALQELDPDGSWAENLLPLRVEDVRGPARDNDEVSEGRRELSWIWTKGSWKRTEGDDEFDQEEEWAKSHARSQQWGEEVILLIEEMRRTIQYLHRRAAWWRRQAQRRADARKDIASGLVAYAHRQADMRVALAMSFAARWRPLLVLHGFEPDWPEEYIQYATANPTYVRPARNRKKQKAAAVAANTVHDPAPAAPAPAPADDDDDDDDDDDEEHIDDSEGEDDMDVSPYR